MLQPRIAIFNVDPPGFGPVKRRISSSCGRLRKKKVPVNCLRSARRQTSLCKIVPYPRINLVFRSLEGSRFHSHLFSRIYRPTGDLLRIRNAAILAIEYLLTLTEKTLLTVLSYLMRQIGIADLFALVCPVGKKHHQPACAQAVSLAQILSTIGCNHETRSSTSASDKPDTHLM